MYVFGSGGVVGKGVEWMRGVGLRFINHVRLCLGCGGVCVKWIVDRGLSSGSGGVGWCYVCVSCESGYCV